MLYSKSRTLRRFIPCIPYPNCSAVNPPICQERSVGPPDTRFVFGFSRWSQTHLFIAVCSDRVGRRPTTLWCRRAAPPALSRWLVEMHRPSCPVSSSLASSCRLPTNHRLALKAVGLLRVSLLFAHSLLLWLGCRQPGLCLGSPSAVTHGSWPELVIPLVLFCKADVCLSCVVS